MGVERKWPTDCQNGAFDPVSDIGSQRLGQIPCPFSVAVPPKVLGLDIDEAVPPGAQCDDASSSRFSAVRQPGGRLLCADNN
jgi:hypothetical protein